MTKKDVRKVLIKTNLRTIQKALTALDTIIGQIESFIPWPALLESFREDYLTVEQHYEYLSKGAPAK